eukprot:52189-Amphidinium_carterae.1
MSLEDHNLATILEDTKTQKKSIVDAHYVDYYLHVQGLGQENKKKIEDKKSSRLTRQHARDIDPILRRNAEKLDDVETMEKMEYQQMKQYHHYRSYRKSSSHLQTTNKRQSTSLPRHSIISAESISTS